MATSFTADEIATIRKFFQWIDEGNWLGGYGGEAITGADDDGVLVTEYTAYDDYGGCSIERDVTVIPWLALTDPIAYDAQVKAEAEERRREEAARQAEASRQREAQERAAYEALKQKYG